MYRRIAILLLLVVFSMNVYRAWTQSITSDEAFAESLFLDGNLTKLVIAYDASHHVLHTLLTKFSVLAFGLSEFTLRLPSLLGGAAIPDHGLSHCPGCLRGGPAVSSGVRPRQLESAGAGSPLCRQRVRCGAGVFHV